MQHSIAAAATVDKALADAGCCVIRRKGVDAGMSDYELWILPITACCALAGTVFIVWVARGGLEKSLARGSKPSKATEFGCTICHRTLIFGPEELQQLSFAEMALSVRSRPKLVGRKLAEYVCPYCGAAHCFDVHQGGPVYAGTNLYAPQDKSANCFECRTPLRRPSWPENSYQGNIAEAPGLLSDHGLVCSRCHAVCCYECCERITRQRGMAHPLICPRCGRAGMDQFFYP